MFAAGNALVGFWASKQGVVVPTATVAWSFVVNESIVDEIAGVTASFTREAPTASGNVWYWNSSGVLTSPAAKTTPRFDHDAATGNANRGLLIEGGDYDGAAGGTINWIGYSYELASNSGWTENAVTMVTGVSSPDTAANRAVRFTATTASATHWNQGVNFATNQTVGDPMSASIHYKNENATQRYIMLELEAGTGGNVFQVVVDTVNNVVTDTGGSPIDYGLEEVGGGFWKVWVIGNIGGSDSVSNVNHYLGDGPLVADHTGAWSGDATNGIIFWQADATWRRVVHTSKECTVSDSEFDGDHFRIDTTTIPSWSNTAGSLFLEMELPDSSENTNHYAFGVGDGNSTDYIYGIINNNVDPDAPTFNTRVRASSANSHNDNTSITRKGPNGNGVHKFAISWDSTNGILISANGTAGTADPTITLPAAGFQEYVYFGSLPFGNATSKQGATAGKQWLRRAKVWNTALSQAQLNALTAP